MTQREFESWREFYRRYPFDDFHRYHRPAALIASRMAGGDPQPLLDWLMPQPNGVPDADWSDADVRSMRALGMLK